MNTARAILRILRSSDPLEEIRERYCQLRQARYRRVISSHSEDRFRGQYGQDQFVFESFFKTAKRGPSQIFVDIGAYDGELFSNSWFFEKELGWTGIAIEPNPTVFERLSKARSCHLINCGIAEIKSELSFLRVSGYGETLSGFASAMSGEHVQRIAQTIAAHGGTQTTLSIPCVPLQALLDEKEIRKIDFLSVDTEGGELAILRTIDWDRTLVEVISIEQNDGCAAIEQFLTDKGFSLHAILGGDAIYAISRKT